MSEPSAPFLASAMIAPELRLIELRVLGAILQFYEPDTGSSPLIRKHIRLLTGYPERNISAAATNLETAGWITKTGATRNQRCIINWDKRTPIRDHHDQQSQLDKGSPRSVNGVDYGSPRSGVDQARDHHDQESQQNKGSPRSGVSGQLGISTIPNASDDNLSNKEIEIGSINSSNKKIYLPIDRDCNNPIKYCDAYNMLTQFEMPEQFAKKEPDKAVIRNWISKGVSVGELLCAIEWAKEKLGSRVPIGPKYVDKCINTLRKKGNGKTEQSFATQDYAKGGW